MIETDGSLNETSRININDQIDKKTNFNEESGNVMESTKGRTLIDNNGPAIIGEDLDNKGDQDFADHVRVKRSEPINCHQLDVNLDFFPTTFHSNIDTINVYSNTEFKDLYANPDHRNQSNTTIVDITHSRHKREVLSENSQRGKRMKRNIKHPIYRVATKNRKKRHDTLKSSRKPGMKKGNKSSTFYNDLDFILILNILLTMSLFISYDHIAKSCFILNIK